MIYINFIQKLKSLSIVPVGLTKHRKGLIELQSVDKKYAEEFIQEIDSISQNYKTNKNPFYTLI